MSPSSSLTSPGTSCVQQQPCPYGKKCTYGNKCKFYHADRGNVPMKTVTDKLKVMMMMMIMRDKYKLKTGHHCTTAIHKIKSKTIKCPQIELTISGAIQETDSGGEDQDHFARLVARGAPPSQVDEPSAPEDGVRHDGLHDEAEAGARVPHPVLKAPVRGQRTEERGQQV